MDAADKLLDAGKTLSKTAGVVVLMVICVSAYLLQRSLQVFVEIAQGLSQWASHSIGSGRDLYRPQSGIFGLSFSFASMTVLWPFILGFFCIACREMVSRHQKVVGQLAETLSPTDRALIELLDPFAISAESAKFPASELMWTVVKHLPRFSLIFHFVSELLVAGTLVQGVPAASGSSEIIWFRVLNPGLLQPALGELLLLIPRLIVMLGIFVIGWRWVQTFPQTIKQVRTTIIEATEGRSLVTGA